MRTSVASSSTATARAMPSCLITIRSPVAKPANTTMMMSAALVMMRPERCSPRAIASRVGTPASHLLLMRDRMNIS